MRSVKRIAALTACAVAVSFAATAGASGQLVSSIEQTAALIAEVTPSAAVASDLAVDAGSGVASATVGDTRIDLPLDPTAQIEITLEGAAPLSVGLPAEVDAVAGAVAEDGTVVYQSATGTDAAVQALADGSVRVQTISHETTTDPLTFTYEFGGGVTPLETETGIALVHEIGSGALLQVGEVQPAWAVDASGEPVETSYDVVGTALVQTVIPSESTVFPVVADPTYGHTYGVPTIYLNRKETKNATNIDGVQVICGLVSAANWALGTLCAANVHFIKNAAVKTNNEKGCVKIAVGPGVTASYTYFQNCK